MKGKRWSSLLAGGLGVGLALSLAACGDAAAKELTGQWLYYGADDKLRILPLPDYEPSEEDKAVAVGIVLLKDGTAGFAMYVGFGGQESGGVFTGHSDPPQTWATDGETLTITDSDGSLNPLSGRYTVEGGILTIDLADGSALELRKPDS
ncbi:MAG: hypothetical protein LBC97_15455 [Bifidobacteriaceae bacterium]|jgi:hypothetical protein|nr:hypothetical protein [Bifidobacteriaceae bacterium]